MPYVEGLRCRECARPYPAEALHVCEWCFGPLEVVYDYDAIRAAVSRESIAAGPLSIWRYADLLPAAAEGAVSLGAGFTPLVRADRLAAELGLGEVWIKNDTLNPTGSFKDRVVSVALTKAQELGFKVAACRLDRQSGQLGGGPRRPCRDGVGGVHPGRPGSRQGGDHGGVRRPPHRGGRQLRRCQPAVRGAGRRTPLLGVRQCQCPHLLRRGLEDPGLRGGGAARLAGAGPRGGAGGIRQPAHQGRQGLPGALHRGSARRGAARTGVGGPGGRLLPGGPGVRRWPGSWSSR